MVKYPRANTSGSWLGTSTSVLPTTGKEHFKEKAMEL
jgi:hypothetical protein